MISAYSPVRNPLAPERTVGGSSGGSAAALRGQNVLRRYRYGYCWLDPFTRLAMWSRGAETNVWAGLGALHHTAIDFET